MSRGGKGESTRLLAAVNNEGYPSSYDSISAEQDTCKLYSSQPKDPPLDGGLDRLRRRSIWRNLLLAMVLTWISARNWKLERVDLAKTELPGQPMTSFPLLGSSRGKDQKVVVVQVVKIHVPSTKKHKHRKKKHRKKSTAGPSLDDQEERKAWRYYFKKYLKHLRKKRGRMPLKKKSTTA